MSDNFMASGNAYYNSQWDDPSQSPEDRQLADHLAEEWQRRPSELSPLQIETLFGKVGLKLEQGEPLTVGDVLGATIEELEHRSVSHRGRGHNAHAQPLDAAAFEMLQIHDAAKRAGILDDPVNFEQPLLPRTAADEEVDRIKALLQESDQPAPGAEEPLQEPPTEEPKKRTLRNLWGLRS